MDINLIFCQVGVAGTAIVLRELWALLLILFMLAAFLLKLRAEEKVLVEEFGEANIMYRKEVMAPIPHPVLIYGWFSHRQRRNTRGLLHR